MQRSLLSKSGELMYLEYIFPFHRPSSDLQNFFHYVGRGFSFSEAKFWAISSEKNHSFHILDHTFLLRAKYMSCAAENVKMCDIVYTFNDLWAFQGWCGELNYPKIWEKETGLLKLMRGWERWRYSKNRDQNEPKHWWGACETPVHWDYKVGASTELSWKGVWKPNHMEQWGQGEGLGVCCH